MSKNFNITSQERENIRILHLAGDLTDSDTDLAAFIKPSDRALILNFSEVKYINSAGIAQLICLLKETQEKKLTVLIHGVSPHYQKIFEMVGLTKYLFLYPDEKSALAAAGILE
ncbi:MAG: STAS domain-containing protein [Desulfitobacterium sp.]|nr:STAS domain-containing protein [Desulfitobacterium sp.]